MEGRWKAGEGKKIGTFARNKKGENQTRRPSYNFAKKNREASNTKLRQPGVVRKDHGRMHTLKKKKGAELWPSGKRVRPDSRGT